MDIVDNLKLEHSIEGIDSNELLIFEKIGSILTKNSLPLTFEFMEKLTDKMGLSSGFTRIYLETLKKYHLISYIISSSGGIGGIQLTGFGVIAYGIKFMEDFDSTLICVTEMLQNFPCTNDDVSNKCGVSKIIVNAVIDYYHDKQYIKVNKDSVDSRVVYGWNL